MHPLPPPASAEAMMLHKVQDVQNKQHWSPFCHYKFFKCLVFSASPATVQVTKPLVSDRVNIGLCGVVRLKKVSTLPF